MTATTYTVAFDGITARLVEVQCATTPGLPAFSIVGLPDKAVSEAKERVRATLAALSIGLPSKRITINLSPADMPKVGSHFDLPIALAILAALEVMPPETAQTFVSIGELSLDGNLIAVSGGLPAAIAAASNDKTLICPKPNGAEAAWVGAATVFAPQNLAQLLAHLTGRAPLPRAVAGHIQRSPSLKDMTEVKGQERAKRALEIAVAGRHHLLFIGSPGCGKSMLAARAQGIAPALNAQEALETSMIQSVAGQLKEGKLQDTPPFRDPHHTASIAAIVGGGKGAGPGEISLAHNGILFLDELPEFPRPVLESLRQPLETGEVVIARANAHVRYPCKFLLIAAANPCRCGYLFEPERACPRVPDCGAEYLAKISGPLMDRFDLRIELSPLSFVDLDAPPSGDRSVDIAARIDNARQIQADRYAGMPTVRSNADADGELLTQVTALDAPSKSLLHQVANHFQLSARGYHRVLRVARTIADLAGTERVAADHIAEAASYRMIIGKGSASAARLDR